MALVNEVVFAASGLTETDPLVAALTVREDIFAATEAAHDASLTPTDPGGISHAERAALAVRIARQNEAETLVSHYRALFETAGAPAEIAPLADPAFTGGDDKRLTAILAYMDQVAVTPREATAEEITAMQAAGVADADIVRLAELNAFLAYQIRLVAGLSLLRGAA
ncbi:hypothetical protein L1787_14070 [Acuticoccus sp. M5D2P5]|uniref:CMD domain-containing protein n=1 Tax=Acuticoccus kalidii TaxID=2910977 RepID=UPI001F26B227|nr:hypothetical protein [Acuticoccus kalidii]MCF3934532.1 hypothetical protein [Acuticoccus kalidii]